MRLSNYKGVRALEGVVGEHLSQIVRFVQFIPAGVYLAGIFRCLDGHEVRRHWNSERDGLLCEQQLLNKVVTDKPELNF